MCQQHHARTLGRAAAGCPRRNAYGLREAIANSVPEGYQPDPEGIEHLIAFAAGELRTAEYKHQVLAAAW